MEIQVAKKLVNAYTNHRKTVTAQQHLAEDPLYNAAENRYASLIARAGPRPWPRNVQHRVNNANKRRIQIYSNSVQKMVAARERLGQVAEEARAVFGPAWVPANIRHLNVRPFVRLLETANARARTIVRKYMNTHMEPKARARRNQRLALAHELAFYLNNNNPNVVPTPSRVKRKSPSKIRPSNGGLSPSRSPNRRH